MRHVIRKQSLQVEFDGDETEARELQRRLVRFCHECLIPVIEAALNQQAVPDEHVFLEELTINAGSVPIERLEMDLAEAIKGEMSRALREQVLAPRGGARRRNMFQARTEAFLHFLEHGTLPWWFELPTGTELERALFDAWRDQDLPADAVTTALEDAPPLLMRPEARRRLVLQFSERFLAFLLSYLAPDLALRVNAVLVELEKVALPAQLIEAMRDKVWEQALTSAGHRAASTEQDLVSRAFMELPEALRQAPELRAALTRHWPGAVPPADKVPAVESVPRKEREPEVTGGAPDQGEGVQEGLYLENGGLVLLHPYLPQLFEGAGISKENRIVDPGRGVALLHYLASGELDPPEYRLALAKVLCGLPLQNTLARDVELSEDEREECDTLLHVMLQHWGALRNSSADGLRGSFLMRPAKLTLRDHDEWLLQVERNSYDILLDQLPWSISMVKLPWMRKLMWVEWN